MKRPLGKNSAWNERGVSVSRSSKAFCHVTTSEPWSVMQCHSWLGRSFSASRSQFASGTMPSEAMNGANQLFEAITPSASRMSGSILPKENSRRWSISFVPT